jgi:predicted YcjX-like family ATPase
MANITTIADEALIALDNLADIAGNLFTPNIRLGVTGLSRAGKTVFITSLVHNLIHGGRMPLFEALSSGRIASARLRPQPSLDVPTFQYEDHVRTLVDERRWPSSTRAIAEMRVEIRYESASAWNRTLGAGRLNIDIVDYPGEWLLDLPLLGMDHAQWSRQALELAAHPARRKLAAEWVALVDATDPDGPEDEAAARRLAEAFTRYLRDCRSEENALSMLPPGRFLMPGDLEGSPALTFAPLKPDEDHTVRRGSMRAMMASRYDAYRNVVVKPFFREHFARLDRQVVLVDALQAINAGPEALADLGSALGDILACFRTGAAGWFGPVTGRRIDRILFAATKADHLHHENHDRLEAVLSRLVRSAEERARFSGAQVEVLAIAAVRATREAMLREGREELPVIVGTPLAGETIDGQDFDGATETAVFPGDLPADTGRLFGNGKRPELRFVRFRPPALERTAEGVSLSLPHIRLDRALQFLLGDRLA